ncbi:hypothetical protein MHM83_12430 [Tenacibaculum sp. Mcav3-52]|uniref:hypothetical protein n=1 Tax=unclassified Tenacibaculum TaxID=2635139 RepID=UPI0012E4B949|nr:MULTISPECIES: hypothetical protein [unclassified Tenacibaculum]MCG7502678.1 hypothetical protein [Tenacibaculum sp. Mcav3-52]MCO7186187.1 hypothetical protein [Tenacibaculum sp. XPcli2-G]GFD81094.1 hypothetical protein KUL118_39560 [Tenacibaculum sp. KUL118]
MKKQILFLRKTLSKAELALVSGGRKQCDKIMMVFTKTMLPTMYKHTAALFHSKKFNYRKVSFERK